MHIYHNLKGIEQDKIGTILHYTGSMFGIGAVYDDHKAIVKIDRLKQRDSGKGYILLMPDISWLDDYQLTPEIRVKRVLQQFWPGNLTVILEDKGNHFPHLSMNGTIAVRVPQDRLLCDYIKRMGKPLISTSINVASNQPEYKISSIKKEYNKWFDYGIVPKGVSKASNEPSTIISLHNNQLKIIRAGSIDEHLLRNAIIAPRLLFICTGNTCRSPLAEFYAKRKICEMGLTLRSTSAGFVSHGNPMAVNSSMLLSELDIPHKSHLSKIMEENDIKDSWLIITMTINHKDALLDVYPEAINKTFTLSEICGEEYCHPTCDIEDPYGLDISFYRSTFNLIKERVDCLLDKITKEER